MTEKFGKSNADYIRKSSFFFDVDESERALRLADEIGGEYRKQPRRQGCVACETQISEPLFLVHGVEFAVCECCGHLNGLYEDTEEFVNFLYSGSGANEAAQVYHDGNIDAYQNRVKTIYLPKVEFMCEGIREQDVDPANLSYIDLGAGGGHFVKAMRDHGLKSSIGYETSPDLVENTNVRVGSEILKHIPLKSLNDFAANVDADVVTMIFSLEHIRGLRDFLSALRSNRNVRFFYFAVPVVNPSVFLEAIFPNVRPRLLGLGHTHLFTDKSIKLLCRDFDLRRLSEWWFGGNAFDLLRFVSMTLKTNPRYSGASDVWTEMMMPTMDALQLAFDHEKLSSEVHLLTSFER